MPMKTEENGFKFLSDSPLAVDENKEPAFGHKSIADSMSQIIKNCPKPFTVGLFGRWGTGKTTIMHWLTSQLKKANIPVAHVDAWKYEDDSLRRQFLITLDEEFELNLKYKEVLNQTLSTVDPTKGKFKFDRDMFLSNISITTLVITLIALALKIAASNPDIPFLPQFSVSFDLLFNLGFAGYLIQLALSFFKRVSVTITEPRTDTAEGFERRFTQEVLTHPKLKNKTVLIIIDNLDRCSDEKAVQMLSTIKTFLIRETEKNECVFLVACDDEAIKKHVTKLYADPLNHDDYNADEFLRKFFNTFIRIPRFIDTELYSYTEALLKETKVSEFDSPEVAHVITSAFRENPRQIKQFINVLLSHFLLAKRREDEQQTITKHVAFLAKILVIQVRFTDVYEQILSNYLTFEESEKQAVENKDYQNFIRATKPIPSQDIRPFLYLKESEHEKKIPGYTELRVALEENNTEVIQKRFEAIKDKPEQVRSLELLLPDVIQQHRQRRTLLLNIVSGSLEGLNKVGLRLEGEYYNKVADLFSGSGELKDDLSQIDPPVLMFDEILTRCAPDHKTSIINKYVALVVSKPQGEKERLNPGYIVKIFEAFLKHEDFITGKARELKQAITEQYFGNFELLALFEGNKERLERYVDEEAVIKSIETLSDANIENSDVLIRKSEILKQFYPIASIGIGKKLLQQYVALLTSEQQKPFRKERNVLLNTMTENLRTYKLFITNPSNKTELSALSQRAVAGANAISDHKQKCSYMPVCILLSEIDQPNKPNLQSQVQTFFVNADLQSIQVVFATVAEDEKQTVFTHYNAQLTKRVQQDQNVLKELYEVASPAIRTQWLVDIINSGHYPNALAFLGQRKYEVDDNKVIIETLLNQAKVHNPPDKNKMYEAVNNMDWKNCDDLKVTYVSHLKELLTQNNATLQEAGFLALQGSCQKKLFSMSEKREIIGPCIDWLDGLKAEIVSQTHTIKSIQLLWDAIKVKDRESVRNKFIGFVFDKLIGQSTNVTNIKFGFEVLGSLDPKVTEDTHNSYFEDLSARIEKELNEAFKKEFESGLDALRGNKEKGNQIE